jgi:hypothetical protein
MCMYRNWKRWFPKDIRQYLIHSTTFIMVNKGHGPTYYLHNILKEFFFWKEVHNSMIRWNAKSILLKLEHGHPTMMILGTRRYTMTEQYNADLLHFIGQHTRPFSHWGDATAIRSRKKSTKLNSWRVVIASWSRWWEKRHYELKVWPVGDCKAIFFLIESQSRRLSGRTA